MSPTTTQIRLAEPADAPGILAVYGPYCDSSSVSFEVVAPSIEQMQERMSRIISGYPWLVCEIEEQIAGYVYASRYRERAAYRWAVEVAIYVAPRCQRRGVGRALYETLFSILREQGYFKAFAGITLPNQASVGLHEHVGFTQSAVFRGVGYKDGRWLDVGWWQVALQPERSNPPEPCPFSAICGSDAVSAALTKGQQLLHARTSTR